MKNITSKFLFTGLACSLLLACSNDSIEETGGKQTKETAGMTQFSAAGPATRTAAKYDPNTSEGKGYVKYFWTEGDKIWVNTTGGTEFKPNKEADIKGQTEVSNFYFDQNLTDESYKVRYTGTVSGNADEVVFAAKQKQIDANSADLIGEYGDCGIATATKTANNKYTFDLDHKAGYLVLNPYSSHHNFDVSVGVRAVYITADQNLTGTYTMDADGKLTKKAAAADGGKQIVWYCKDDVDGYDQIGNEPFKTHFRIFNSPDADKNGIIIVLPPGEYTNFTIEYLLIDWLSEGKGYYKKTYKKIDVKAGQPHYIAENIKLYEYDKDQYYTWDAGIGEFFWKGHDKKQILIPGDLGFYPTREEGFPDPNDATDSRAYNRTKGGTNTVDGNKAERSAAAAVNVNEALWLAQKGEPMWDKKKMFAITYHCNICHLYNGGVWFKTLKKIATDAGKSEEDLKTAAPNGKDYRTEAVTNDPYPLSDVRKFGRPAKANTNADYMFLPCTGSYNFVHENGVLNIPCEIPSPFFGMFGGFWTSSADAAKQINAYTLQFTSTQDPVTKELEDFQVGVLRGRKYEGYPLLFNDMGVSSPGKFRIK